MTAVAAVRYYVFTQNFIDILKLTREIADEYFALNNALPDITQLARFAEVSLEESNYYSEQD